MYYVFTKSNFMNGKDVNAYKRYLIFKNNKKGKSGKWKKKQSSVNFSKLPFNFSLVSTISQKNGKKCVQRVLTNQKSFQSVGDKTGSGCRALPLVTCPCFSSSDWFVALFLTYPGASSGFVYRWKSLKTWGPFLESPEKFRARTAIFRSSVSNNG